MNTLAIAAIVITLCNQATQEQFNLKLHPSRSIPNAGTIYGSVDTDCDTDVRVTGMYATSTHEGTTATLASFTSMEGETLNCPAKSYTLYSLEGGHHSDNNYYTDDITLTIGACDE